MSGAGAIAAPTSVAVGSAMVVHGAAAVVQGIAVAASGALSVAMSATPPAPSPATPTEAWENEGGALGPKQPKDNLTTPQAKNLKRFEDKLPAGAGETAVNDLPSGGKSFQAEVPGRVPGSKAIYEKQIDAAGETLQFTKTTVDPSGNIVHVKDKITGTVVTP